MVIEDDVSIDFAVKMIESFYPYNINVFNLGATTMSQNSWAINVYLKE